MVPFLEPETDVMVQFLAPEIVIMGKRNYISYYDARNNLSEQFACASSANYGIGLSGLRAPVVQTTPLSDWFA